MAVVLLIAFAVGAGAVIYARVIFKRYVLAVQERQRTVALFSRYVPPQVVDDLLARKDARLFEAREYYATILCARIRNFSLLAEALSPEETLRYLNEFYTIVGQAVQRHRGMIESLRGDTVIAVFGVLVDEQFQEERALRAALEIMRVASAMEARWLAQGRRTLEVGIGVNSGKIVAGDTGFQQRREFAIIGNPAHVAARLEAASEELNAAIIASETTYAAVRDLFIGVPTSTLPLKGLRRLQNAFIIRGLTKRASADDALFLPSDAAFARTSVAYDARSEVPLEADAYIAPERPAAERSHIETAMAPAPAHTIDERLAGHAGVEFSRFSLLDDELAAIPEPPPLTGTYEDGILPPFQLPP